jgi:hypothetical protein
MQTRPKLAVITACSVAVCAYAPFAAGEPKNQPPFTRHAVNSTVKQAQREILDLAHIGGEPKNEWPFIRRVNG